MGTLYLDKQTELVRCKGGALVIGPKGARSTSVPLSLLDRVVINGNVQLSTTVVGSIVDSGASLILLTAKHGRRVAIVHGRYHSDASVRIAQYASYRDRSWRERWARRFVLGKIRGYVAFFRHKLPTRPDRRFVLKRSIDRLVSALATIQEAQTADALTLDMIRGIEGAAARTAFDALAALLPPEAGFRGRNRRPPKDPANACLSLAYTLIHADAVRAAYAGGLDPYVGYLHDISYGRESLACDLVEILRPEVDRFVCALFNDQTLRARDFSRDAGGCFMKKAARQKFYPAFEAFARGPRRLLRRTVRLIVRHLREREFANDCGTGQVYLP